MSWDVMKGLEARAKADPRRVVLPEANEEKIIRAAREVRDRGVAIPLLVGEPGAVAATAQAIGVSLEGITIVDSTDETRVRESCQQVLEREPRLSGPGSEAHAERPA